MNPTEQDRLQRAWDAVGQHATAPELIAMREQALARARRANARRWLRPSAFGRRKVLTAAAVAAFVVALGIAWQLSPYAFIPGVYRTGVGEQRVVELDDHSRIALDAKTRLWVRFSEDARVIELIEGQAQFSVAKDPRRPFKVIAGGQSIVAVGTSFTVEYVDHEVRVALLEGKVVVSPSPPTPLPSRERGESLTPLPSRERVAGVPPGEGSANSPRDGRPIELIAGEELRIAADGETTVIPRADLEAAVAWRQGKVIFRAEPLGEAVRRLNRYSRLRLEIDDPALAALQVSGVFDAGDTQAFAEAVQAYLPVTADYSERGVVRLTPLH